MLMPKVIRKQISHRKFQRIAKNPDSKKSRVFLYLEKYKITTTIENYVYGGYVYSYHGKLTRSGFKTYYYRYEMTGAVCLAGRDIG